MAYFFGFFGISFLDTNAMARSPSSFGLAQLDQQLNNSGHVAGESGLKQRPVDMSGTMCAKEAPQLAGGSPSRVEKPTLPPLVPIPEGDEYAGMSNDEVGAAYLGSSVQFTDHTQAISALRDVSYRVQHVSISIPDRFYYGRSYVFFSSFFVPLAPSLWASGLR